MPAKGRTAGDDLSSLARRLVAAHPDAPGWDKQQQVDQYHHQFLLLVDQSVKNYLVDMYLERLWYRLTGLNLLITTGGMLLIVHVKLIAQK